MAAARAPAVRAELNGLAGGATASPSATQSSGGGGSGAGVFGRYVVPCRTSQLDVDRKEDQRQQSVCLLCGVLLCTLLI